MSEDIAYRQRRYLISMGVRVVAFLLAVFLFHGVWRFVAAAVALVVPYFAVVFANGGREPSNSAAFDSFEPNLPDRATDAGAGQERADGASDGGIDGGTNARTDGTDAGTEEHHDTGRNGEGFVSERKLQAPSADRSEC